MEASFFPLAAFGRLSKSASSSFLKTDETKKKISSKIEKKLVIDSIEYEPKSEISKTLGDINKAKKIAYGLLNGKEPIVWLGQEKFIETISIFQTLYC